MRKGKQVKDEQTGMLIKEGSVGAVPLAEIVVPDAALIKMELPLPIDLGFDKKTVDEDLVRVRREKGGKYRLLSNLRAYLSAVSQKLDVVPAVIYEIDEETFRFMEQVYLLKAEKMSFLEEGETYAEMIQKKNLTQENLAFILGKSQSTIANKMRLLGLNKATRAIIVDYDLTERHARELLRIKKEALQLKIAKTVVKRGYSVSQEARFIDAVILAMEINDENKRRNALRKLFSDDNVRQEREIEITKLKDKIRALVADLRRGGLPVKAYQISRDDYVDFCLRVQRMSLLFSNTRGQKTEIYSIDIDKNAATESGKYEEVA